jgi:hypothetical protein
MPTASDEVRKPWHNKRVWVKTERNVVGIGRWNRLLVFLFGYARIPLGDRAAEMYLLSRGYREHRFMFYAPKLEVHRLKKWKPTQKETSALRYLIDEWDYSYDLRKYPQVLMSERKKLVDICMNAAPDDRAGYINQAMLKFASLARALA